MQNGELMEFRQEQEQEQAQEQAGNVADKFQYRPENAGSLTAEPINGSQPESSSPFAPSTDPEQGTEPEEPHGPESTPEQGPRI